MNDNSPFNVPAGAVRLKPMEMNNLHLRDAGKHTPMADKVPSQPKNNSSGGTPPKRPQQ